MAVATRDLQRAPLLAERRFFLVMSVAIATIVLVGFARTFFLRPLFFRDVAASETFFYVHGAFFAAWFALLIVQASLITTGRIQLHRRLGVGGACLATLMVALGSAGGLIAAHRPADSADDVTSALAFLIVPLFEMLLFAVLITCAIARRRNPQSHKRLILIASISLLSAAFVRWPVIGDYGLPVAFAVTDSLLLALVAWDLRSRGGVHPATIWAGSATILSHVLRVTLATSAGWLAVARWAVGLLD